MPRVSPDRVGAPPAGAVPDPTDIDTCLRVLAQAGAADPDDPRWSAVHQAAAQVHRAGKKRRKASRHADRVRRDRDAIAAATRFQQQDPAADPEPAAASAASAEHMLLGARRCYGCKTPYRRMHPDYHLLCHECAEENLARRSARCDLRGRRAIVTGGRVKIGFHVALKLLRDGADVLVTTRFPRDAARRFAAVPESADWLPRLHVHGVDLLDLAGVAGLLEAAHRRFDHLDILVNNAAQTIRRPAAYHRDVRAAENAPLTGAAALVDVVELVDAVDRMDVMSAVTLEPRGEVNPDTRPSLSSGSSTQAFVLPVPSMPAAAAATDRQSAIEALFPSGRTDETGQPLDLRSRNSWSLRLHEVDPVEWLEVQMVNAFAPFVLTAKLRGLLEASPWPDRYVVQVSAMEGSFSREHKTVRHPHTNMAKASLNMLTRTAAADYAASGIYMNSVDTGWVTDERPHPGKTAQREMGFRPPLDVIDGAARVYDPIVRGVGGRRMAGLFLKDYRPVEW